MKIRLSFLLAALVVSCSTSSANAYIGPGAGFAVVSSFFIIFLTGITAFLTILIWPFRAFMLYLKRRKTNRLRKAKRVIVIGLDGFDPGLANKFMKNGILPNFKSLAEQGGFRALGTTCPSISPVAWSTYATGVNPGKHRIFDFYTRDPNTYLPILSSVRVSTKKEFRKIGPFKTPFTRTKTESLRKSTSFWQLLGKHGIFSSVIRVPISFPPEKMYGNCLSAMCTPDIRGSQGSFTFFSGKKEHGRLDGGLESLIIPIEMNGTRFSCRIPGPSINSKGQTFLPMEGEISTNSRELMLKVGNDRIHLEEGVYSPWIRLRFKAGARKRVTGITRFLATNISTEPEIYMTPINIYPEKPSMPISYPFSYCISLAKLNGLFATLGLAEDTWALNERIIDEKAFLKQSYDIFEERKSHLCDALK